MDPIDYLDPADFDESTPIAEDLYRHVNGGWLAAHPVPAEYPAWGAMFEVHVRNEDVLHGLLEAVAAREAVDGSPEQMVGDYFAAGMDEEAIRAAGIAPLRPYLDRIDAIESSSDVAEVLVALQEIGVGAFHSLGISPDFEDASKYMVYFAQGGLGLPERDYYLRDDERSVALVGAYQAHVATQLGNLGGDDPVGSAAAIVDVERRLAEASLPAEKLRDRKLTLNRHDVDALDELMPHFGMTAYARSLGVVLPSVNVDNAGFFEELDEVLADTDVDTIRSYLRWNLVRRYASALPKEFEDAAFEFYGKILGGQQEQRARWKRVLAAASADIGEQVSRLYVASEFTPRAKERCELMVTHLLEAMERSIRSLEWMTEETKQAALTKLAAFGYKIGYPDEWKDYSGLDIGSESFVTNRIQAELFEHRRQFGRLTEPVDNKEWAMPAHVVNAYYHPVLNEIVFPAGILQPPFFYDDADDALIYGGIGTVIGHEITHGFDDQGSQFDEAGRFRSWWNETDRAEFEQRAEGLVAQFSEYAVADDQNVNGRLTLGENIADLGGLKIAFDAFVSTLTGDEPDIGGFTPRQRFFLAYGTIWRMNYTEQYLRMLANVDVHSPNPFRVNGPVSNFPPFAEVFEVGEGSPMWRGADEMVEIW